MPVTDRRTPARTRPTWPFHVVALVLVLAGLLLPHALLVAAGLILCGSAGLARPRAAGR
ncbi:hypothetical protein [Lentzea sp.]|uniref:hypothetical protein n=1 Tax=Lentzea sp. TaxID=56099 RepID=UPI002ED22501